MDAVIASDHSSILSTTLSTASEDTLAREHCSPMDSIRPLIGIFEQASK